MRRKLALISSLILLVSLSACGPGNSTPSSDSSGSQNISSGESHESDNARYQVEGTVKVAISEWRNTDLHNLWANFNEYYPNIKLEYDYYASMPADYLTARASAGALPDVLIDESGPNYYYASQGWMHPLNDFVKDDPDFSYVPEVLNESYTYNGKLYALPMQAHFNAIVINTDLLDTLNMDLPEYDWTPQDYMEFLKEATTSKYSGTETLVGIDENFAGTLYKENGFYGYNMSEHQIDLSAWVEGVNMLRTMRVYPGLEAWSLRNSNVNGDESDYSRKFGNGNLSDNHMATKMGLVLSAPLGTWDSQWLKADCKFTWEFFPYPQGEDAPGHMPLHVDCAWVVSSAQNPQAAFEVARFFSYSLEGNLERMAMYETGDTDEYTLNSDFYIPTTNHPEVREHFVALPNITGGIVYMYDNMKNCYRGDLDKLVPGWNQVKSEYLDPRGNEVRDGIAEAAATAAELETAVNKSLMEYWTDFEDMIKKVQEEEAQ